MTYIFLLSLIFVMVLVLASLVMGLVNMVKGEGMVSNYYMRLRIFFQGLAIVLFLFMLLLS